MQKLMRFFWWLRPIIQVWVRSKVFPNDLKKNLSLDPHKPICFVLKSRSFKDLMVLDHNCEAKKIPKPRELLSKLKFSRKASFLYLSKPGLFQAERTKKLPSDLFNLIGQVSKERFDVQMVPVSIFWGRNPGRGEKSLFKLLFFDDEYGGFLQRLVTFFVHGRNVFCNFGKPISLLELVDEGKSLEETTKKLRRVLKVHFRRQRETIVGPYIYDRAQVINSMLQSKTLRAVIDSESAKSNVAVAKIEKRARKYAEEVCAKVSPSAIRLFDIILSWLWKKIYSGLEVRQEDKIRELAEQYELVYMPSHRSHMDYLLIGYVLYYLGLLPPHTIAGKNLNFWPVGPLLRRGGAIFIRRTFRGNRLYGAVVSEFVHYLLSTGFPLCFYPEGGRSRTGYLLQPKVGILSMVLEACRKRTRKPVLLVPIYVGYDRVMEAGSYQKELGGKSKKRESLSGLIKAVKLLRSSFGKAYIGFGEPLQVETYLENKYPNWREAQPVASDVLKHISEEMMKRTNSAAVVSPVSLIGLILQSSPKKALSESDLLQVTRIFVKLGSSSPLGSYVHFPDTTNLLDDIKHIEELSHIIRFRHQDDDVIYLNKRNNTILDYYRNNIVHLFFLPSMLCHFLVNADSIKKDHLLKSCKLMYGFVYRSLFLPWNEDQCEEIANETLSKLLNHQILIYDKQLDNITLPEMLSDEYLAFKLLAAISSNSMEKYGLYSVCLSRYLDRGSVQLADLDTEILQMSKRMSILNGMTTNIYYDDKSYKHFLETLRQLQMISTEPRNSRKIIINDSFKNLSSITPNLISPALHKCILKVPITKLAPDSAIEKKEYHEKLASQ